MSFLYFDESIREHGDFIIGALVKSEKDLTPPIHQRWVDMGLDPKMDEYKSSATKTDNETSRKQRNFLRGMLQRAGLALTVSPLHKRTDLGNHCVELVLQLVNTGKLSNSEHVLYIDQNIKVSSPDRERLNRAGVECLFNVDSRDIAGIQLADHAAHALGGMPLEEMGILTKRVRAGENSGYSPEELLDLGFELWANLRYALIGNNEYIEGLSPPPDDPANPFFRVDGYGLYVSPSCSDELAEYARKRFGVNYLGCIH